MRKLISGLFAVLLIATLAACSSSGSDDSAGSTTTTTATSTTTTETPEETTTTEGSGGSVDEQDYIDGLTAGLAGGDEADGDLVLTEDEAACVAEEWVSVMDAEELAAEDVDPEELEDPDFSFSDLGLTQAQGEAMVEAFDDCDVDIAAKLLDSMSSDLDATQKACLEDELTDEIRTQLLVEALTLEGFSDELGEVLEELQTTCNLG